MRKHYVVFYSPGTFFDESSSKPIKNWNIKKAIALSKDVVERYGARPYGFRFETYITSKPVPDGEGGTLEVKSKLISSSGIHFIGGKIRTLSEIKSRNDPNDRILIFNMECSDYNEVVESTNGYRSTHFFYKDSCIVDENGNIVKKGTLYGK